MADVADAKDDKAYKQLIAKAFMVYALPYLCLIVFLLDMLLDHTTGMVFWALFLLLELPCSVIGLRFTIRSENLKQFNNVKREIAWEAGIFIGVSGSLAGVFTLGLLFVVTA